MGEIERVELSSELAEVLMSVRLDRAAMSLAREGSRFWVVRPELGLDRVAGIETLLGPRHLAVLPGAPGAAEQHEFVALEDPPLAAAVAEGSLEVLLEAPRRFALTRGAPNISLSTDIPSALPSCQQITGNSATSLTNRKAMLIRFQELLQ